MKSLLLLLSLVASHFLRAQSKPEAALKAFENNYPTEKIFLQYNKTAFVAGQTLWFKAYTFTANTLSSFSTNLYVELYDSKKAVLKKLLVPLIKGTGEGSLEIKKEWEEGVYYIRAYTLWSLNWDESFPYIHAFNIYNPASEKKLVLKPIQWKADVFPESGKLLAGIKNKVSVRLTSIGSLPQNWKGKLIEKGKENSELLTFSSLNNEVGYFEFEPQLKSEYLLQIIDHLGTTKTINLPQAVESANLLQVEQRPAEIFCKAFIQNSKQSNLPYQVIAQMHNQLVFKASIAGSSKVTEVLIPIGKLTDGVLHISLFDPNGKVVAERLTFVQKTNKKPLNIERDSFSTSERRVNRWSVVIDTVSSKSFALLIQNHSETTQPDNFLTSLLLTNDVNISVNEPSFYFSPAPDSKMALDALLISAKWKWFDWNSINAGNFPIIKYHPDNYLSYTGAVFLGRKLQLNKPVNLIYQLQDSTLIYQENKTDSSGAFHIDGAMFYDTATIYYQLKSKRAGKNAIKVHFESNNKFQKLVDPLPESKYILIKRNNTDTIQAFIKNEMQSLANQMAVDNRYRQLQAVIVRSQKNKAKDALSRKLSSTAFQSGDEQIIDFANNKNVISANNITDYIKQNIAGLNTLPYFRNTLVDVYLDEMKTDFSIIRSIPVSDIAMIKFLRYGSAISGNPMLLVYTKRGDSTQTPFYGMPFSKLPGYITPSLFPSVDFSSDLYSGISNDTRSTLFWNAASTTDGAGKSEIRFYNNDISKKFRIIIIGFNADGSFVYEEQTLE